MMLDLAHQNAKTANSINPLGEEKFLAGAA
jgi:hypothetical protein